MWRKLTTAPLSSYFWATLLCTPVPVMAPYARSVVPPQTRTNLDIQSIRRTRLRLLGAGESAGAFVKRHLRCLHADQTMTKTADSTDAYHVLKRDLKATQRNITEARWGKPKIEIKDIRDKLLTRAGQNHRPEKSDFEPRIKQGPAKSSSWMIRCRI